MTKPNKIVLSTFGSYGDIHPYMAIALELQARGHAPVIATGALYREKIEGIGLNFAPVRPNLPPPEAQDQQLINEVMNPRTGPRFLIEDLIFPALRDTYADLAEVAADADLIVTHPASPAGPLVAQKLKLPWVSTVLAPMSFLSAYDPPVPPYWPWIAKLRFLGPRINRAILDAALKSIRTEVLSSLRQELDLPDTGHPIASGQHSPELVLALFSSIFAEPQPDWPAQTMQPGFCFYDGGRELPMPSELERFLDSGPPPIVFTLGTSAVWVARDFYRESVAAAVTLGRRSVFLIGDERNRLGMQLPENMIAVDYAPYQTLLPRACAMVHHGGIGTTSQGLRAGIPTLIVPFAFDQPDNASHAERLGTSRTLARKRYQARRAAAELDVLLNKPQYAAKAKAVGELIRAETGAATTADLLEKFLQNKRRVREPAYAVGD